MPDIGYYTLPIIPSMEGIDAKVSKQLSDKLGSFASKAGKDFSKNLGDGMKAGEGDVKRALDGYSKLYDKWADSAGKVKVAQAALEDLKQKGISSGGRYERAIQAQEKALRDQNRALRDAKDAFSEYDRAAKRAADSGDGVGGGLLDKLKGMAGSARDSGTSAASGFVEGFGGPIAAIGTKAGPIGLALAAAAVVATGAGVLIAQNVMAGMDQEANADAVQAKLGIDEASMAKISGAAGKAYSNNFGESVKANMDAASAAIQSGLLTGADDPATQKTIERLSTVSQLLGEEIPRVSRSASQLIRTGIAKDSTDAFDLIVKGQQSGLNVSEDWLDTLDEYSTQFRKLGLTGADTLGLLSQMTKNGARDTDVAADAIKEFSIRAIDGSQSTNQAFADLGLDWQKVPEEIAAGGDRARNAFQQVTQAISQIDDPVKRSQVQVALFGTQAEDLGDALNHLDLSNAAAQLGQVDGAAQRASDTLSTNTAASVETAKRAFETGAASMQQSLAQAFGPGIEQIANFLVAHQDDITGFFQTAANAGAEFGSAIVGTAAMFTRAFGMAVQGIGDAAGWIVDSFENVIGAAATVADAVGMDGFAGDLRSAKETLGGLSDDLHGAGDGIVDFSKVLFDSATKLHDFDAKAQGTGDSASNAAAQINNVKTAVEGLPGGKQINIDGVVVFKDQNGRAIDPSQLLNFNPNEFATAGDAQRARRGLPYNAAGPVTPSVTSLQPSLAATSSTPSFSSGGGGSSAPPPYFDPSLWQVGSTGFDWDAVAAKESGGNWANADTGNNGHYGGLQFSPETWRAFGGDEFAPMPNMASRDQQIAVANRTAFTGYNGVAPQGLGAWEVITKGLVPGVNVNTKPTPADTPSVMGTEPAISMLARVAKERFGLDLTSGKRDWAGTASGKSYHLTGEAGDFSNAQGNSPQQAAFAEWLNKNFGPYLAELIYSDPSTPGVSLNNGKPFDYGAQTNAEHQNHVHVAVKDEMAAQFEQALSGGSVSSPYNSSGTGGGYQVDQQAVYDAESRVLQDKNDLEQKRLKLLELQAQGNAKQSELLAAQNDITQAERSLQSDQMKLEEAKRGKFTEAKTAQTKSGRSGGMGQFGELGSIAGSFLKETFGLDGSFLPDLSSLGIVQTGGALLNAFAGPLQGLVDGGLGIQQPGWSPGMPVNGVAAPSLSPFGMGSTQMPALPDATHPGTGAAPGPVSIDNSTTINSPTGDPNDIENRIRRTNMNRPRIDSYAMPGT